MSDDVSFQDRSDLILAETKFFTLADLSPSSLVTWGRHCLSVANGAHMYRARCEGKALLLGYQLLVSPPASIDEVIESAISLQNEDLQSAGGPSEQIRRYYRETA